MPPKQQRAPKNKLDQGDKIGVSFGVTLNMGDYQSLKIEAWVESTKREGETSKQAFDRIWELAEEEANSKAAEYKVNRRT